MLLKFAMEDYISDREFKNVSPATLTTYQNTLKDFHKYCVKNEIVNVEDIATNDIKGYLKYCKKVRDNNPVTINHKLRNLKMFFNYLIEIETINENPTKKIQKSKEDTKIDTFTDYHIKQMLGYFKRLKYRDKTFFAYRGYTIIVTLLGTGIRLGELCNLKWKDIDLINCTMTVFGKKRVMRSIPLTEKLVKELSEYQIFCKQYFCNAGDYVFTNNNNEKTNTNAVKCVFKRLKEVMNFKDVRVSAHTFRHTFSKNWILSGGDVFSLQKILGHQQIQTTMIYVNLFGTALQEQNEKFNPLNTMDI